MNKKLVVIGLMFLRDTAINIAAAILAYVLFALLMNYLGEQVPSESFAIIVMVIGVLAVFEGIFLLFGSQNESD